MLTTAEAVQGCGRITLDGGIEARVRAADEALDLALLTPATRLVPMEIARFAGAAPRLRSEIAVSGYSYEGRLGAPTLTFGTVEELRGLDGRENVHRLALAAVAGDAGGPVLDQGGGVVGVLLPPEAAPRRLPEGVSFAAAGTAAAAFLSRNGVAPARSEPAAALAPEDLVTCGAEISVLVGCWD